MYNEEEKVLDKIVKKIDEMIKKSSNSIELLKKYNEELMQQIDAYENNSLNYETFFEICAKFYLYSNKSDFDDFNKDIQNLSKLKEFKNVFLSQIREIEKDISKKTVPLINKIKKLFEEQRISIKKYEDKMSSFDEIKELIINGNYYLLFSKEYSDIFKQLLLDCFEEEEVLPIIIELSKLCVEYFKNSKKREEENHETYSDEEEHQDIYDKALQIVKKYSSEDLNKVSKYLTDISFDYSYESRFDLYMKGESARENLLILVYDLKNNILPRFKETNYKDAKLFELINKVLKEYKIFLEDAIKEASLLDILRDLGLNEEYRLCNEIHSCLLDLLDFIIIIQ